MSEPPALVLDNGTSSLKCGYAGSNFPTCVVPTIIGRRPLNRQTSVNLHALHGIMNEERHMEETSVAACASTTCGTEAMALRDLLELSYPIRNGIVQNMDEMQLLWDHVFHIGMESDADDLRTRKLLLSEVPLFSTRQRSQLYEVMFETYGFAAIQSSSQSVLTLFASGLQTGVAVECGEGVTHCTPVYEGNVLESAHRCVHVGGAEVTRYLARLLQRRYGLRGRTSRFCSLASLHEGGDLELIRQMKEKLCYTAVDLSLEHKLATETTALEMRFVLPDGAACTLGQERFEASEVLFQPDLIDVESEGLSTQLWNCLQAADIDIRAELYSHIVLSGGSTLLPGFLTRLGHDVQEKFVVQNLRGDRSRLWRFPLKVEGVPGRKLAVFLGGSTLADLTASTPEMWLSKAAWEEGGASAHIARYGA